MVYRLVLAQQAHHVYVPVGRCGTVILVSVNSLIRDLRCVSKSLTERLSRQLLLTMLLLMAVERYLSMLDFSLALSLALVEILGRVRHDPGALEVSLNRRIDVDVLGEGPCWR